MPFSQPTSAPPAAVTELLAQAAATAYCRPALRALGAGLPADDGILAVALNLAADRRDAKAFSHLYVAALYAGRRVSAEVFGLGAALLPDATLILNTALRAEGDVAAALATTRPDAGIDMLIGTGGARQGILTAAALRCAGGDMQARFKPRNESETEQAQDCGIHDYDKRYSIEEMASGSVMFAGTGVTNGDYLRGVRFSRGGAMTNSVVMRSRTHTIRFIEATHRFDLKPDY